VTLADRAVATLGFHLQQLCARRLPEAGCVPSAVRGISELRYGLRRDGLKPALLAECFMLYAKSPASHVRAAAARLAAGGVVELADPA